VNTIIPIQVIKMVLKINIIFDFGFSGGAAILPSDVVLV
jgi:hypothetical protein